MARPHAQLTVDEMTVLVKKHRDNVTVLRELEYELGQRTRPKARTLRDEVRALLNGNPDDYLFGRVCEEKLLILPAAPPFPEAGGAFDRDALLKATLDRLAGKMNKPKAPAMTPTADTAPALCGPPAAPIRSEPRLLPRASPPGEMNVDSAHRILGAERNTPWEKLEAKRRETVQKAHPDLLRELAPQMAQKLVDEAALVNAAYACLMAERAKG